jgi:hypothetical protein
VGTTDTGHIRVVGMPVVQARRDFPAPYGSLPAERADSQSPTVAITVPVEEEWRGAMTVVVDADDDDTVVRVELYLDGQLVGQALSPPYQFELDTWQYPSGAHTLQAVAYDYCLNQADFSRQVTFVVFRHYLPVLPQNYSWLIPTPAVTLTSRRAGTVALPVVRLTSPALVVASTNVGPSDAMTLEN